MDSTFKMRTERQNRAFASGVYTAPAATGAMTQ